MSKVEITSTFKDIINNYISGAFDSKKAVNELIKSVDPEEIYTLDDAPMIVDCYFAIKHLEEEGFKTTDAEIKYFQECLSGLREYSLNDKNVYIVQSCR